MMHPAHFTCERLREYHDTMRAMGNQVLNLTRRCHGPGRPLIRVGEAQTLTVSSVAWAPRLNGLGVHLFVLVSAFTIVAMLLKNVKPHDVVADSLATQLSSISVFAAVFQLPILALVDMALAHYCFLYDTSRPALQIPSTVFLMLAYLAFFVVVYRLPAGNWGRSKTATGVVSLLLSLQALMAVLSFTEVLSSPELGSNFTLVSNIAFFILWLATFTFILYFLNRRMKDEVDPKHVFGWVLDLSTGACQLLQSVIFIYLGNWVLLLLSEVYGKNDDPYQYMDAASEFVSACLISFLI